MSGVITPISPTLKYATDLHYRVCNIFSIFDCTFLFSRTRRIRNRSRGPITNAHANESLFPRNGVNNTYL